MAERSDKINDTNEYLLKSSFEIERQVYVVKLAHGEITCELLGARQPPGGDSYALSTDSRFSSLL